MGNAGVLARGSLMPFNHPGLWAPTARLLKNDTVQFRYRPRSGQASGLGDALPAERAAAVFRETVNALDGLIRLSALNT